MHGGQKNFENFLLLSCGSWGLDLHHKAWLEVPLLAEPSPWPHLPYKGTTDQIKSLNLLGKDFTDEVIFCQTSATFLVSSSVFFICSVCLFVCVHVTLCVQTSEYYLGRASSLSFHCLSSV